MVDGCLAGLGFGLLLVCVGRMSDDAGLHPLVMAQGFSVVSVIATAIVMRQSWVPRVRASWRAVAMGPLGALATGTFLYATHHGLLSVVSVISSLYPASTVLLAALVLRERVQPWQGLGLALAAAAVALVSLG